MVRIGIEACAGQQVTHFIRVIRDAAASARPVLQHSLGLRGTLLLTAGVSALGALLTLVLPEPAGRSLEEISGETGVIAAAEKVIRDAAEPTAA